RSKVTKLSAAITGEGDFLEQIVRSAAAVLQHAGEVQGVLEKGDAIQAGEVDGAEFAIFRQLEREADVVRAFQLFGDLSHRLANGERPPTLLARLFVDAIEDVGAFERFDLLVACAEDARERGGGENTDGGAEERAASDHAGNGNANGRVRK